MIVVNRKYNHKGCIFLALSGKDEPAGFRKKLKVPGYIFRVLNPADLSGEMAKCGGVKTVALIDVDAYDPESARQLVYKLQNKYGVPCLLVSSGTGKETIKRIRETKPAGYYTRPLKWEDLKAGILLCFDRLNEPGEENKHPGDDTESLLDNLPGMAFRCLNDRNWTMLYLSAGCRELTGYPVPALMNNREMPYEFIIHPADRNMVRENIGASLQRKKAYEITYRIITMDRETRWVLERGRASESTPEGVDIIEGVIVDITAQKEAESRLIKEEEMLKGLMRAIPGGVGMVRNRVIIWVNDEFCRMSGYPEKSLIGRKTEIIYPSLDEFERVGTYLYRELEKSGECVLQSSVLTGEGVELPVLLHVAYINPASPADGIIFVATDISVLKKMETELRESELKYSQLVRSSPDSIMVIVKGKYVFVNPAAWKSLGYSNAGELVGRDALGNVHPEFHNLVLKRAEETEKGRANSSVVMQYLKKNGETLWVETYSLPIVFGGEKAVMVIARDITERKLAEEILRQSEHKYRELVEKAGAGIMILDLEGNVAFANRVLASTFGYSLRELMKKNLRDLVLPADLKKVTGFQNRITSGDKLPSQFEFRGVNRKGHSLWLESKSTLLIEEGKITGTRNYIWDVSRRKMDEEHIRESYRQIRELSRHLDTVREEERKGIAREVHDELGQILTALKMDISWLEKKPALEKEKLNRRVSGLKDLVDMAIQSVQRISAELRPSMLDDLGLQDALEWLMNDMEKRSGIGMELVFSPDASGIHPKQAITVFRLVQESLTNILRHSDAGQARVTVSCENKLLQISVEDDGKGITEEQINSSASHGLMGMRERALLYDGEVRIEGEKGKGTRVNIQMQVLKKEDHDTGSDN